LATTKFNLQLSKKKILQFKQQCFTLITLKLNHLNFQL